MKPERFISIMLITTLLSCEMSEQPEQKIGEVVFESNQHIMHSTFDIDIYIDGKRIEQDTPRHSVNATKSLVNEIKRKLEVGIHEYEIKIYTYDGTPGKSIKGRFIISENTTSEVFVDFTKYNHWI